MTMALVAILLAGAGEATLPEYRVGDAFVFSDGRVERVQQVEGDNVRWGGLGKISYLRNRNPIMPILEWKIGDAEGKRTVSDAAVRLWPLAPGKATRFRALTEMRKGKTTRRTVEFWKCAIGRPRAVPVPAGIFEAWPIRCDRYSAASMRLAERVSWDWSSELGHYVRRRVTRYSDGATHEIVLEAALSGEIATLHRLRALSDRARKNKPSDGEMTGASSGARVTK